MIAWFSRSRPSSFPRQFAGAYRKQTAVNGPAASSSMSGLASMTCSR